MPAFESVLDNWYEDTCVAHKAHYFAADYFSRMSYLLGIPVIGLTAFVGNSVFATLQKQPEHWLQVTVGFTSVLAAVLASLQTFLGYSTLAEKHRVVGVKYEAVGRELQALRASAKDPSDDVIKEFGKRLEGLALESPHRPAWSDRRAKLKTAIPQVTAQSPAKAAKREKLKHYLLAAYIAFLIAGAAGGAKLMPLPLGPFAAAVTVLSFAVTLLILDCVNQLFGEEEAKRFVLPGFLSLLLATGSMWVFVRLPFDQIHGPEFRSAYEMILLPPFRMFGAGLTAYLVGQLLNIYIFGKIRQRTTFEQRGFRNVLSTLASQFIDTLVFVPAAFWGLYGMTIHNVGKIFVGQFAVKASFAVFFSYPVFMSVTKSLRAVASSEDDNDKELNHGANTD